MARLDKAEVLRVVKELARRGDVATPQLVKAMRISRQAAGAQLSRLARQGVLLCVGAGPKTRYQLVGGERAPRGLELTHRDRAGLDADALWSEVARNPLLAKAGRGAREVLRYAFVAMVKNAVEHSGAETVSFGFAPNDGRLAFEVRDDGAGIFQHVMTARGLESPFIAVEELSKGRFSTQPDERLGEGLYFTSRLADAFEVESGEVKWLVDNLRRDTAIGVGHRERGTRIRFELRPARVRPLADVLAEYKDGERFAKTEVRVKLFEQGRAFIARSEGRRLMRGLEKFDHVVLDFAGVSTVGQGFVDEVFRVWARAFPGVALEPENMAPPVEFMVKRGLARASELKP